jgi:dipeptidase D
MKILEQLQPQPLFNYFEEICQVPRPSKKEEKIRTFLLDFAKKNNLQAKTDKAGNVLISKPAASGRENSPTLFYKPTWIWYAKKTATRNLISITIPLNL